MRTSAVEDRVPQGESELNNSSRTRSNSHRTEDTQPLRQNAISNHLDGSASSKPTAPLRGKDKHKMSSSYTAGMQDPSLDGLEFPGSIPGMTKTSSERPPPQDVPIKSDISFAAETQDSPFDEMGYSRMYTGTVNAPSGRAPPQDAPMERHTSIMHSDTPDPRVAAGVPVETVYSEQEDNTHDPIQSPPFVLFSSSSQSRNRVGTEVKSSKKGRRKKAPLKEQQTSSGKTPTLSKENRQKAAMQETIRLQETRIEALEQENRALHSQVKRLIEMMGADKVDAVPEFEPKTPDGNYNQFLSEDERNLMGKSRRDHFLPQLSRPRDYSPGTKFVTEFCESLELDVGHHALLANIMDNHYFGLTRFDQEYDDL